MILYVSFFIIQNISVSVKINLDKIDKWLLNDDFFIIDVGQCSSVKTKNESCIKIFIKTKFSLVLS